MATIVKKMAASPNAKASATINAKTRIKPRGLRGMFKDIIIINGTDEEVFSLNRLAKEK